MKALRALLSGIVDYAGLYPPAALDMAAAVRNYASYASSSDAWMLGRFVVPAARLAELHDENTRLRNARPFLMRLSVVLGTDAEAGIETVRAFNSAHGAEFAIDVLEARLSTEDAIERAAALVDGEFELFAEIPVDVDPEWLIAAIGRSGVSAKIRTGGVTPDAFPSAHDVVRFMRRCIDTGVRFKATAGLHHPLSADYPLTYEPTSLRGTMYGYLNLFLTAAFMANGLADAEARALLEEGDRGSLTATDDGITWRGHALSAEQLVRMRVRLAVSFGSCSFREPVDELQALSLIA
jgi:hypothetical protein